MVVLELILIMRIGEHAPKGTPLLEVISLKMSFFLIQQRKNIKQFMLTTGSIWLVEIQIYKHFGPRLSTYRHALTHTNRRLELVIDSSLI